MDMNQAEQGKKMSELISKCWADEGFKRKLLADPEATLKAEGAKLPAGMTITAHENTSQVFHLVIPTDPAHLSDEDLDNVAGGVLAAPKNFSGRARPTKDCGVCGGTGHCDKRH